MKIFNIFTILGISAWLISASLSGLSAQNEEIEKFEVVEVLETTGQESANQPVVERGINVMKARTLRAKSLLFTIDHRARQSVDDKTFDDFLGLDSGGLKIGLGLRYGIMDNLEAGFFRLNGTAEIFDVYEFDIKYGILKQKTAGFDLAFRGGVTWFAQKNAEDASGALLQLLAGRSFSGGFRLNTGLLYHSESSNDLKTALDDDYSIGLPVSVEIPLTNRVKMELETVFNVSGYGSPHPVCAFGLKYLTYRHSFMINLSNTQYISADGIVSGSGRGGDDIIFGFTITREFNFN